MGNATQKRPNSSERVSRLAQGMAVSPLTRDALWQGMPVSLACNRHSRHHHHRPLLHLAALMLGLTVDTTRMIKWT